jgi:hypothetical protein
MIQDFIDYFSFLKILIPFSSALPTLKVVNAGKCEKFLADFN